MEQAEIKAREIYEMFDRNKHYCHIYINREIEIYKSYMHFEIVKDLNEVKQHLNNL